ncbi:carbohydrate kinase [Spirochaeta isovalerica]|uniref:Pseudouridine kinase n=1 Tax=Spirochaeta isovalerica TaxID=150 RepID=A0A841R4X9_9SPIO|nr:carbohydrate kinase [Spirochaeta isovalerica]MBB6478451.1 pseudouridine kinase [Spirochaeta isovalerica]
MTKREKEILELIRANPMISQLECAEKLGISRSAAAGHIMNLISKGYIAGKGYILNEEPYAVVIGGSNIDILGTPLASLIERDSNPGTVTLSPGGVGRNIAENLARMGSRVKLLTVLGDDLYGEKLLDSCRNAGIDTNHIKTSSRFGTSVYLSILDGEGDMISAVSDMQLIDELNRDYLESKKSIINGASLLILDANLSEPVLKYLAENYGSVKDIFVDTVSTAKAGKVTDLLRYIHTIKPNILEAEVLSALSLKSGSSPEEIADKLLLSGLKRVYLSLGIDGILYKDSATSRIFKREYIEPVNTTGAGDAFTAALAHAYLNDFSIDKTLAFASAASQLTILSRDTINKDITAEKIEMMIKEGFNE